MLKYNLIIKFFSMIEIFFCVLVYTFPFRRKKSFPQRMLLSIASACTMLLLLCVLCTGYSTLLVSNFITFSFYIFAFFAQCFLYTESKIEYLLTICAAAATQIITGRIFEFLYILLGKDPYTSLSLFTIVPLPYWLDILLYCLLHFVIIFLLSCVFRRKKIYIHSSHSSHMLAAFSITVTLVSVLVQAYSRPLEPQNASLAVAIRFFAILYALMILIAQTGILEQDRINEELRITKEVLNSEKKQFESVKNDMNVINTMCHDLRHQLNQYTGKLTSKELEDLKSVISIYDSSMKTGNEILYIILYKKQTIFQQNNIQFSCIANGACLSFLSPTNIYSLFNNAIDNAIYAVSQISNPDMRIISLTVNNSKGIVEIHLTNYFDGELQFEDGLPKTNKPDTLHHGFGVKSIRYIVEQNHGSVSFSAKDSIFYLDVYFEH